MAATTGMVALGNYAGAANDTAAVAILTNLIANPDSTSSSGAIAGGSVLDQMSPACAAQLRVELAALSAAVGTTNTL